MSAGPCRPGSEIGPEVNVMIAILGDLPPILGGKIGV
jgi:hypothetical protein